MMADRAHLERLSRELTDKGKLIEAGWIGMRIAAVAPNASAVQLSEMRSAFFAGAQHLYSSIMTMLEPGAEPTDNDLNRFEMIDRELKTFINDFTLRNFPSEGSA